MNNLPGTFSLRNHFSSSPLFRPRSGVRPHQRCDTFFEGTTFPHARPAEPVRPRGSQGNRVRKGTAALFSREPLFLLPSGRDWRSRKQGHWADRGPPHLFRRNHFPSFRWVHGRPVGPRLSPTVLLALHS